MRLAKNILLTVTNMVVPCSWSLTRRSEAQSSSDRTPKAGEIEIIKCTFASGPAVGETKTIYELAPNQTDHKIWNVVYDEAVKLLRSTDGKGHKLEVKLIDGVEVINASGVPDLVQTFDHEKIIKEYSIKGKCYTTYAYAADGARTEITYYPDGQKFVERDNANGKVTKWGFEPTPTPVPFPTPPPPANNPALMNQVHEAFTKWVGPTQRLDKMTIEDISMPSRNFGEALDSKHSLTTADLQEEFNDYSLLKIERIAVFSDIAFVQATIKYDLSALPQIRKDEKQDAKDQAANKRHHVLTGIPNTGGWSNAGGTTSDGQVEKDGVGLATYALVIEKGAWKYHQTIFSLQPHPEDDLASGAVFFQQELFKSPAH